MNYLDFEAEDFASNESFQNWHYKRNAQDIKFWEQWIASHPTLHQKIADAIQVMDSFDTSSKPVSNIHIQNSWNGLSKLLGEEPQIPSTKGTPPLSTGWNLQKSMGLAASLILIAICAAYFITRGSEEVIHHTGYGETISITLPDNSVVTLNSNSKLHYLKPFGEGDLPRKVSLEGEAYFSVVHTASHQPFLVTTPDQVTVQVLGTEFNVKQRPSGTKVVLNAGKIALSINDSSQNIIMEPGELVAIPENSTSFIKKSVNTDLYTSWKCRIFVFEDTPLVEVISLLEDNYGLQVEVTDDSLLEQKVSGSVPSDNIKLLMEGLSASFGLTIQHTQNQVKIMRTVQ